MNEKTLNSLETFTERAQYMRAQMKLKQFEIAKLLNINTVTYNHYETGYTKPTLEILIPLAEIFQVSPSWLAYGDTAHILQKIMPEDRCFLDRYNFLDSRGRQMIDNLIYSEACMKKKYKPHVT